MSFPGVLKRRRVCRVATPRYFIASNWFRELEAALAAVREP